MKCPKCHSQKTKVVNSRHIKDFEITKRSRFCKACNYKFNTIEKYETKMPDVIKNDGKREKYSREKMIFSLKNATQKSSVTEKKINSLVDEVENEIANHSEIESKQIVQKILNKLKPIDEISFIRYAICFSSFKDYNELKYYMESLITNKN